MDSTTLMVLFTLATHQAAATSKIIEGVAQMLDYLATNPDTMVRFVVSDMVLDIHSNVSYLPE